MNKIFKIIWNKTTQRLEVVSELTKSQGKATASADNRVKVSSTVGFKKSVLLTAISLALGLSAVSLPAAAVELENSVSGQWGTSFGWKNTINGRLQDKRWPIVVGRENSLAPTNGNSEGDPSSATLMGRENNVTKGLKFSVFGDRNNIHSGHTNIVFGTDNTIQSGKAGSISTVIGTNNTFTGSSNLFLTAIGNNIRGLNPSTEGVYIGNNVTSNASPIAIGNNVYSEIGGSAIGHNIGVRARTAESDGGFLPSDTGFAIGSTINSYGDHLSVGRHIDLSGGKTANTTTANNKDSVYIGEHITTQTSQESLLVGSKIKSNDITAHHSVGVGSNIVLDTDTKNATALGSDLTVNGKYSLGVGTGVNVSAENAIGIGRNSVASADSASALGLGANATDANATAIGRYARATVGDSVALGREAKAETAAGDVAIGSQSETSAVSTLSAWNVGGTNLANSYATNVKSTSNGVVSVGSSSVRRQIKNVAAGDVSASSTDAVNGAQLYWLSTKIGDTDYVHVKSTKTGNKGNAASGATGSNSVAVGPNATASSTSGIAIGDEAKATSAQGSLAVGQNANASNNNATAIGRDTTANGTDSVAVGLTSTASGASAVAIGKLAKSTSNSTVALGQEANATGVSGTALGYRSQSTGDWSVAAGPDAKATGAKASAFGNNANATKEAATAVGFQAQATGIWTAAVGPDSRATADFAVAMGNNANATAVNATAIGHTTTAGQVGSLALGNNATANTTAGDIALGQDAATAAQNAGNSFTLNGQNVAENVVQGTNNGVLSVGSASVKRQIQNVGAGAITATSSDAINGSQLYYVATALNNVANDAKTAVSNSYLHVNSSKTGNLGALNAAANATGANSIALGPNATASGASSLAIGDEASNSAAGGVSIGQNAINNATNSTVIGRNAQVTSGATDSVAIGLESIVTNTSATAIGKNANASGQSSISIGQNTLTQGSATAALGYNVTASAANATAVGSYGNASGKNSITIGAASASIDNAVAIGNGANTTGSSGTAVGTEAKASGGSSSAFGQRANASNTASLALGYQANATGCWTTAVGPDSTASGNFTVAIGNGANATKTYAVAIGKSAKAIHENSVALGSESETQDEADITTVADLNIDGVEVAKKGVKKTNGKGSISVGKNGLNRQIFNVGAGRISADSTDAINGSQLFHVANATKTAIQGIKDTTFTFNIANGVTDATLKTGSQAWSIGAQNSITFGATSDLSVTRKDGFIVYGLSDEIKNKIELAKTTAEAAKTAAEAAKTTAGEAKTIAQEAKNNSPYEIWKAKPENANKSKDDFLTSLKGAKGDKGDTGAAGAKGATGAKGDKGDTGLSAKAQWLADNPTKTEADYATAIKGEKGDKGDTGLSAKAQWLADNPTKTEADYAKAIKGEKGDTGAAGAKGDTGPVGPRGPKGDAGTGGSETKVAKVTTDNSGNLSVKPKANGDTEITLGKDLKGLNSISIGSGPSEVSITENGLNNGGHRITNVAAGVKPTDAANVAQVNAVENRLNNKIGKLDKKLRGGIANAVAVANIPQVTIPGANMVAVGTGNYKGQSALAVGYSRASDNNRVIIKMSASATTQGDYSVGGGIGYQW